MDVRVRKAISLAINRDAMVSKVMENIAVKAGQLLPKGFHGVSPKQFERYVFEYNHKNTRVHASKHNFFPTDIIKQYNLRPLISKDHIWALNLIGIMKKKQ